MAPLRRELHVRDSVVRLVLLLALVRSGDERRRAVIQPRDVARVVVRERGAADAAVRAPGAPRELDHVPLDTVGGRGERAKREVDRWLGDRAEIENDLV